MNRVGENNEQNANIEGSHMRLTHRSVDAVTVRRRYTIRRLA
jgi:hypothetical protein